MGNMRERFEIENVGNSAHFRVVEVALDPEV